MKLYAAITSATINGKPVKGTLHVKYSCPYLANGLLAGFANIKDLNQAISNFRAQRNKYRAKFQIVNLNKLAKHGIRLLTRPSLIATSYTGPVYRLDYVFI